MIPEYWLLVPAAGSGTRFGGEVPKQYLPLAGSTVLQTSLQPFLADPQCRGVTLVLSPTDSHRETLLAALPAMTRVVTGAAERAGSVLNGLESLRETLQPHSWVLVHDAVRPCLSAPDLQRLLLAGAASESGALLAAPLADTLKRAEGGATVAQTLPREGLWRALTPQMFRYGSLCAALRTAHAAGRVPTDEAQAMEWQGDRPLLVAAQDSNIKITTAGDLPLAAAILATRAAASRGSSCV